MSIRVIRGKKTIFVSMISIIVAASENNAIGREGELLWNLPNDMKFFKNTTWGLPAIMGRKTFESLSKPLAGRINIIVTKQADWKIEGAIMAADIDDALQKAAATNCKEIFIIGGGEIYRQSMHLTDRIYLTRVHHTFDDADAFFPAIDENIWELKSNEDFSFDAKHAYAYSFQVWEKRK